MNTQYEELLRTVGSLVDVDDSIQKEYSTLLAFVDYLNRKKDDISAFHIVEKELMQNLADYDFENGISFNSICDELDAVCALRLKLFNMKKEALRLSSYPDCYDLKKTIDDCGEFLLFCFNTMSLSEVGNASGIAASFTQKLISIQTMIVNDTNALKAKLQERSPEVWEEDAQRILAGVIALSKGDGDYSIVHLRNEYSNAKNKRINDINEIINQYPWLEKDKQKKQSHDNILKKQMSYVDYRSAVDRLREGRRGERIAIWISSIVFLICLFVFVVSNSI